jgi:penicillin-binding protein 1A
VAPIWRNYMSQVVQGTPAESFRPISDFEQP